MKPPGRSWPRFSDAILLAAALFAASCGHSTRQVRVGETFTVGNFALRVQSINVADRRHQGVELDVEIRLSCDGGNRFDRIDFADSISRSGRVYLRAQSGWRERLYLSTWGESAAELVAHAYPPADARGLVLSIRNPSGEPGEFEVDLGR